MGIESHAQAVPPDWHPDPAGRHQYRYWDGRSWTDHVADNGQQAIDPLVAFGQSGAREIDDEDSAKQHGNMLIKCATCGRDFFKLGEELGTKKSINCPNCGSMTPIVAYSPAQEAANRLAQAGRGMISR